MFNLKKSTAAQKVFIKMVDSVDGYTPETGIAAPDTLEISKAGGAFGAMNVAGGNWDELAYGWYIVIFDATDTATAGTIGIHVEEAGCRNFDAIGNVGPLDVNTIQISGDSTAADNLELQYDTTGLSGETFPATQLQIGNLSVGSAAVSTTATGFTKTTGGAETSDYESTTQLNEVYHIIAADGSDDLDIYYEFSVGGNGVPVTATWVGYAQSKNDVFKVWARNWTTYDPGVDEGWEQIGVIDKPEDAIKIKTNVFDFTNAQVGTGTDAGKVHFRISSEDCTLFAVDRLLCSYSVVFQSVGYANGCIWVNTNVDNENSTDYVDGVADNPVSTWAAALTLSTSLGIKKFCIINGSTITLTDSIANFTLLGQEWSLALEGKNISNAHFEEADVTGIGTTIDGKAHFHRCFIGDVTLGEVNLTNCGLRGTLTLGVAGTYLLDSCFAADTGEDVPPEIDFVGSLGSALVGLRDYNGGIKVINIESGDKCTIQGIGHLTIDSTCSDGELGVNGCIFITDEVDGGFVATGSGTIIEDARYDVDQITSACDTSCDTVTVTAIGNNVITTASIAGDAITNSLIADNAIAVENIKDGAISAAKFADNALSAAALATDAVNEIVDATWNETSTGHTTAGMAGAQLWTDIDAILVDTGTDGVVVVEMKAAALKDFFDVDSGVVYADAVDGSVVKEIVVPTPPVSGAWANTITVRTTDSVAIEGAIVWISSSASGTPAYNVPETTDSNGQATIWAPNGTWYIFAGGAGYSYSNDESMIVSDGAESKTVDYGTLVSASAATGGSTTSFLLRSINRIRLQTDEPETNAKYSNTELITFIQEAYAQVMQEIQRVESNHIYAIYTFTYDVATKTYILPDTIGRIISIGEETDDGYKLFYESGGDYNRQGSGCRVEGNILRFSSENYLKDDTTVTVRYLPSRCSNLYEGNTTTFTTTTLTYENLILGTRSTDLHSYVGCTLRVLTNTDNAVSQERLIYTQSGDDNHVYSVEPAFSPVLSGTVKFEIIPPLAATFDQVIAIKASMSILQIEGNSNRYKMLEKEYRGMIRTITLMASQKDGMRGGMVRRDGPYSRRGRGRIPTIY